MSCYLLLSGQLPFKADNMSDHDIEEVFAKVKGDALDLESGDWKFVSQGAKDFVASLLQKVCPRAPPAAAFAACGVAMRHCVRHFVNLAQ